MAVNWTEVAQKMPQAARAGVAIERKRLQELLAERQKKSSRLARSGAPEESRPSCSEGTLAREA